MLVFLSCALKQMHCVISCPKQVLLPDVSLFTPAVQPPHPSHPLTFLPARLEVRDPPCSGVGPDL